MLNRVIVMSIFFTLLLAAGAAAQSRAQLCKQYSVSPQIYQCCIAGIEDYDACMAYIGGGQAGGGTVQERTSTRPPPTYRSGGREFESRDGMQAYDSLVACRRAGLDSCPSYSRIMQMAYGKFNAAIEACRGNKRCIDNVPGFNLDDIYQAGVYARTDAPLKKAPIEKPVKVSTPPSKIIPQSDQRPLEQVEIRQREAEIGFGERYVSLSQNSIPMTLRPPTDPSGSPIDSNIFKSGDRPPTFRVEIPLKDIHAGKTLKATLPEGSSLKNLLMTLSDPIAEGMTAVTVGTTPQLLRHPEIPVLDQTRYELKYYFSIDTTIKEEESHPFKEAMFNFYIPVITQYERGKVSLMRYNSDEREWFRIPTERVSCDAKGCDYVSISPGTSVFAIAVEKDEPEMPAQERLGEGYLVAAIAFGLLLGIGVIAWRHRSAARFAHGGKKP